MLLILILSGEFIFTASAAARGDQDQDILMDEELKEMTYDDLEDILAICSQHEDPTWAVLNHLLDRAIYNLRKGNQVLISSFP